MTDFEDVDRYYVDCEGYLQEHKEGDVVMFEDYKALQDEVERLRNYIKLSEGVCA